MRAKTENGRPTPAYWAFTSWVRRTSIQTITSLSISLNPLPVTEWLTWVVCLFFLLCRPTGVWLEGSDGTDINALCRSHSERLVAVADDFCKVHLFQYPCPKPKVRDNTAPHLQLISLIFALLAPQHSPHINCLFLPIRPQTTVMRATAAT